MKLAWYDRMIADLHRQVRASLPEIILIAAIGDCSSIAVTRLARAARTRIFPAISHGAGWQTGSLQQ